MGVLKAILPEPQIDPAISSVRWIFKHQIALPSKNFSNQLLKLSPTEFFYRIKPGLILQHSAFAELIKKRENCRGN
jgi:hypothetical protein